MVDRVKYQGIHASETVELEPDEWEHEDGLLRMDLEDETLFVPFDRLERIRRVDE